MSASARLRWRVAREMARLWKAPDAAALHGRRLTEIGTATMRHAEGIARARGVDMWRSPLGAAIPIFIAAGRLAESGAPLPAFNPACLPGVVDIRNSPQWRSRGVRSK